MYEYFQPQFGIPIIIILWIIALVIMRREAVKRRRTQNKKARHIHNTNSARNVR